MADFIQEVFNDLSFKDNVSLWLSTDDRRVEQRLAFLSGYDETAFRDTLQTRFALSVKNDALAKGFVRKCEMLMNEGKATNASRTLDKALIFASKELQPTVLALRDKLFGQSDSKALTRY